MSRDRAPRARCATRYRLVGSFLLLGALVTVPAPAAFAFASPAAVGLGTAGDFTVLAAATVTNSGNTVVSADAPLGGNLGVSPGSAVTGFPPGAVTPPGAIHAADATAASAQASAGAAYDDAKSRTPDSTFALAFDLVGHTYTAGVYAEPTSLALTGTVTLDAEGNPDAVFIFQAGSTLITAASSKVLLVNGAQACNVFWQVGSSATLGAGSAFNGTVLAHTSISVGDGTGGDVEGRLLAGSKDITGAVTLLTDKVHTPVCAPTSGVSAAPLFGRSGQAVAMAALLAGAGLVYVRRRARPAQVR